MTECTRCGTETNNPGLSHAPIQGRSFLDEWNTVIWLCDQCVEEWQEWLRGPVLI